MGLLAASDVTVALIAACATFICALIGALATGGIRADQRKRDRRAQMAAARLVHGELIKCAATMETVSRNSTPPSATLMLPKTAWEAHSQHLASSLPYDVWSKVHFAYFGVDNALKREANTGNWTTDAEWLQESTARFDEAIEALSPHLRGP